VKRTFAYYALCFLLLAFAWIGVAHAAGNYIIWIVRYGQSLSVGWAGYCSSTGYANCTSGSAYGSLMMYPSNGLYPWGNTSFTTLVPKTWNGLTPPSLESPATSMCNQYNTATGRVCATDDYGWPGASYAILKKGATSCTGGTPGSPNCEFNDAVGNLTPNDGITSSGAWGAQQIATGLGKKFYTPAVSYNQGESEMNGSTTYSTYEADMVQLQSDYQTSLNSVLSQTGLVPLFIWQKSSWASASLGGSVRSTPTASTSGDGVPVGQFQACLDHYSDGTIFCFGPDYPYAYGPDGVHKTAVGYRQQGAIEGAALARVTYQHLGWKPFAPRSITVTGQYIDVQFWVPTLPLVLDTTNVAALPDGNYGFELTDTGAGGFTISSVALKGATNDTVRITLSGTPAATETFELRYAWTSPSGHCSTGVCAAASATSNNPDQTGSQTFAIPNASSGFGAGDYIYCYSTANPANYMTGTVTSYGGGTSVSLNITAAYGSTGTSYSDWKLDSGIGYAGPQNGPRGNVGDSAGNNWNGDSMRNYALTFRIPGISGNAPYSWNPSEPTNLSTIPGPTPCLFPLPNALVGCR
jgi:hypothetical protein